MGRKVRVIKSGVSGSPNEISSAVFEQKLRTLCGIALSVEATIDKFETFKRAVGCLFPMEVRFADIHQNLLVPKLAGMIKVYMQLLNIRH
jgi:hypothetical protein